MKKTNHNKGNYVLTEKQLLEWVSVITNKAETTSADFNQIVLNNVNLISDALPNMIRTQLWSAVKARMLKDSDFGHWFRANGNGIQVSHVAALPNNQRTASVVADQAKISNTPSYEVKTLFYLEQATNDIRINLQIQNWAHISSSDVSDQISMEINNSLSSIDISVVEYLKNEIETYAGYYEENIDPTDLTDEELSQKIEAVMSTIIQDMTADYNDSFNELVGTETEKRKVLVNTADIGLVFNTKNIVLRDIGYIRKQYFNERFFSRDWGVGHITAKNFESTSPELAVVILPKQKFYWAGEGQALNTQLGYSLIQNLLTNTYYWGSLFMKGAPAAKITVSVPVVREVARINRFTKMIKKLNDSKKELTAYQPQIGGIVNQQMKSAMVVEIDDLIKKYQLEYANAKESAKSALKKYGLKEKSKNKTDRAYWSKYKDIASELKVILDPKPEPEEGQ